MEEKRHVMGGPDGWLRIKQEPGGGIVSVPEYLQVTLHSTSNGRDYFTVLEGVNRGRKFSVTAGNLGPQRAEYQAPAHLTYSLGSQQLRFPLGMVRAITDSTNPITPGAYPIQLPDHPHGIGAGYMAITPYAKTWFYLGHGAAVAGRGDRYLHPGRVSLGCISVEPAAWTQLYRYLILCRSSDGKSVGRVTVVR